MKNSKTKQLVVIVVFIILALFLVIQSTSQVKAESQNRITVKVGALLVNIEKVDLSESSSRLDFYLWFSYNPSEINMSELQQFEFINGSPTLYIVDANEALGYLEYRVKGDFINSFDFSNYPFETHNVEVKIEHKNLDVNNLMFESDSLSKIDSEANVAGWNIGGFKTSVTDYNYGDQTFSRFIFNVSLERPAISSFTKTVVPLAIITAISLLAFFMAPQNFSQRITLGVTTLLSATAFHLSLISGIPPTGYLTLADRMMISVYVIFLYNLASSVYIMKSVDDNKMDKALWMKKKSLQFLPVLIVGLIVIQILI